VAVTPAALPAPIDGGVFALPHVSYGAAVRADGVRAFTPGVAFAAQSGAQEAMRRQVAEHIERELARLPAPPATGRCTLVTDGEPQAEPQLLCDSNLLLAALGPHTRALAQLMAVQQRGVRSSGAVALEVHAGRYRLSQP
jgi:hypothetical protein